MKKIAITGNIASGKTQVENIISDKGYKVLDTDKVCHLALDNDKSVIAKVVGLFDGFNILDNNGNLDRNNIGEAVFANNEYKQKLENILHPFVKEKIKEFFKNNENETLVFVSVPLLFEAKMENMFDKIILVFSDEQIRFERLIKRNNYTQEYAEIRIKSQMPQEDKVKLSDFVINNNSDFEVLKLNIEKVLSDLL